MGRPTNKTELLELSSEYYERLMKYIDSLSKRQQEQEFPEGTMNRNIRDVLGHLYHWQLMFLQWYEEGMSGKKPDMPAKGYTWKMTPELNRSIREQYTHTSLRKVRKLLEESHQKLQDLIQQHNNKELFVKKQYIWTGSTSLGAYLVSATSSHYDWAFKLIRKSFQKAVYS